MAPSFYCISRTGRGVKGVYRRCPGCEIAQITVNRALFLTLWATVVAKAPRLWGRGAPLVSQGLHWPPYSLRSLTARLSRLRTEMEQKKSSPNRRLDELKQPGFQKL